MGIRKERDTRMGEQKARPRWQKSRRTERLPPTGRAISETLSQGPLPLFTRSQDRHGGKRTSDMGMERVLIQLL